MPDSLSPCSSSSEYPSSELVLADGLRELAADPGRRGSTGTVFEDVPGSFRGSSSSSESMACASWPMANHSASSLPPWFSSPFVLVDFVPVDFLFSVAALNGHSRDSVVPRLLTHPPHLEWPEAGSAAPGGGAAGWPACGGTCGGARSRDLDLGCLLERPRCLTDDDGPADGKRKGQGSIEIGRDGCVCVLHWFSKSFAVVLCIFGFALVVHCLNIDC